MGHMCDRSDDLEEKLEVKDIGKIEERREK